MSTTTKEGNNYLSEGKVLVQYIPNFKNGITDKTHPLYGGLSSNAAIGIPAPLLSRRIEKIFSKDELEFLAEQLNEKTLAPNSEFWREFRKDDYGMTQGNFPVYLKKEGAMFDKSKPLDHIIIRILQHDPIIAKSHEDAKDRESEVRFLLIEQDKIHTEDLDNISAKKKGMKLHSKFEKHKDVLSYILKCFNKNVSFSSELPFLQKETWKLMEADPSRFVRIASDELIGTKILLDKAVRYKLLTKSSGLFYTASGEPVKLDDSINDYDGAAKFLASGAGQEMKLELQAEIKKIESK
jgi:hypothetical protein